MPWTALTWSDTERSKNSLSLFVSPKYQLSIFSDGEKQESVLLKCYTWIQCWGFCVLYSLERLLAVLWRNVFIRRSPFRCSRAQYMHKQDSLTSFHWSTDGSNTPWMLKIHKEKQEAWLLASKQDCKPSSFKILKKMMWLVINTLLIKSYNVFWWETL